MMMGILQMKSIKIMKIDRVTVSSIQQKVMKICFLLRKSIYTGFCNKMIFCHMGSGGDVSTGRPSSPFMVANNQVMKKFHIFLSDIPGEKDDVLYFQLR